MGEDSVGEIREKVHNVMQICGRESFWITAPREKNFNLKLNGRSRHDISS
jgi:ribosomal protein L37E